MRRILLLSLSSFLFVLSASAQGSKVEVTVSPQGSADFILDEGQLQFRNLHLNTASNQLSGVIFNTTAKQWVELEILAYAYDAQDNKCDFFILDIPNLMPGESQPLLVPGFIIIPKSDIRKLVLFYNFGKYPVAYKFTIIKPVKTDSLHYEDDKIEIGFSISRMNFNFSLRNKTDDSIIIHWDQMSFIDTESKTHRAVYGGWTALAKKPNDPAIRAPLVVPPTGKLDAEIFPDDWKKSEDAYRGSKLDWEAIFPAGNASKLYAGKTFSLFVPLEINHSFKNYLFTFQIDVDQ